MVKVKNLFSSTEQMSIAFQHATLVEKKWGGLRVSVSINGEQKEIRRNDLARMILNFEEINEVKSFASFEELIVKINALNIDKVSKLTKIKQFFGNLGFNRNKKLAALEERLISISPLLADSTDAEAIKTQLLERGYSFNLDTLEGIAGCFSRLRSMDQENDGIKSDLKLLVDYASKRGLERECIARLWYYAKRENLDFSTEDAVNAVKDQLKTEEKHVFVIAQELINKTEQP